MKKQDVFNKVFRHLLTQNKRSMVLEGPHIGNCLYYGPGTLRCAVGCLIPEDRYHPVIEGVGISSQMSAICGEFQGFSTEDRKLLLECAVGSAFRHKTLLFELQAIHDATRPSTWHENLIKLAKRRRLKVPKV